MDSLLHDARFALRSLRRSPGFAAVAILTLALGIGANTAIFSVVNAVLLRPLPYADPDRLVRLFESFPWPGGAEGLGAVSTPNFRDWREQSRSFAELAGYSVGDINLQGVENPERLSSVAATANLFSLLGVSPRLGRTFAAGEDEPSAAPVAVVSEGLWRRRFGGDPQLVGRTVLLDGEPHTVIGVMPASFRFPAGRARTDVWVPLKFTSGQAESRGSHWMAVLGRLRPGVSFEAAQTEMSQIARRLEEAHPAEQAGRNVNLRPLREVVVGSVRPALLVLLGAAGLVLLIACANAANLQLVRAAARRRETAIRAALGAGRWRVVRQFLTEALLLALGGAALGLLLAHQGVQLLSALAGETLPRATEIGFDSGVFVFLLLITVLTAAGFGLVPALQAASTRVNEELQEGGKGSAGRRGQRFRSVMVVGQIALSLVLLIGAGLLMKTFVALLSTETGMQTENVLTLSVSLPAQKYAEGQMAERFYAPVLERVQALPGVSAAGWINLLPLQDWGSNGSFGIEGMPSPANQPAAPFAEFRAVSPGYFTALGILVHRGRDVTPRDTRDSEPGVLINRALAERYFPGEDPVGRRLLLGDTIAVAGVVGDVRQGELDREPMPEVYFPYTFQDQPSMTLVVSTRVPPASLTGAVREAIHAVDPDQPIYNVQTMQQVVVNSISDRRLYLWLLGTFAALALVLAAAGIYGVISYSVAQRSREIGIRVALGAQSSNVLGLVVGQGARLALLGLLIGVPAALALTRLLASLLYRVSPSDPLTFLSVALLLAAVALLASYLPARRAARVDPMIALRSE